MRQEGGRWLGGAEEFVVGENGADQIPFDYKKALKGDNNQGVSLQPGDTIVVR